MIYEAIIVGGGVMGTAAAYSMLKRGVSPVLLLEQYTLGHDRAASTDRTKAIRYEYAQYEIYSRMVGRSIQLWRDLEAATGTDLYVNCGVVCWGRGEESFAERSYNTLKPMGVPIEEIDPQELCRIFPQFSLADMSYATHNTEGGFLRASNCVMAFAGEVRRLGGEIKENAPVRAISQSGGLMQVQLESGERIEANRVIMTPGAWGANLFPSIGLTLPLTAHKQQVVYIGGLTDEFAPGNFPVFLNLDHDFYGFPLDSLGLFKASIHLPGELIDPDIPLTPDQSFTDHLLSLLAKYIPRAAQGKVVLARNCMYAMMPDEDFIIDRLPGYQNVIMGAGFSGHGFKFAPLIGELLAALSLGEEAEFALAPFSLSRFSTSS